VWRFSDGTEVEPGGEIRGTSLFAQRLRAELGTGQAYVSVWPAPSAPHRLDPADTGLLDTWLSDMLDRENRFEGGSVRLTKRHDDISELPPPPWQPGALDPTVIY
jgi:hypothetical protein